MMSTKGTYGYAGKILRVNLGTQKISLEQTSRFAKKFLGGRGINWAILYDEIRTGTKALSPENVLAIGVGPLVGTILPASCRVSLDAKNLFNEGVGSSNMGGHWGPELKFAGYDNIVITGKAEKPTYLWINNGCVEFRHADHLWGKTTWETPELIREEHKDPDIQVLCIGPAGENLVLGSCVVSNKYRVAGRCGMGTVMGSKNLKAIAVRGTGSIEVADTDGLINLVDEVYGAIREQMKPGRDIATIPTKDHTRHGFISLLDGDPNVPRPVRNSQDVYWPWERMGGRAFAKYKIREFGLGCFSCPLGCAVLREVKDGPLAGAKSAGLEANNGINFGSRLGIYYLPAIIKLTAMTNQLGYDEDVFSVTMAWAMECYQRGILTLKDTEGIDLTWGNYESAIELLEKMAYKRGKFATLLADGVKRASEKIGRGSERYAFHVKSNDLYEELRVGVGWALGMATSSRGGTHLRGTPFTEYKQISRDEAIRLFGIPTAGEREAYKGKGKLVVFIEQQKAIADSLGFWDGFYPLSRLLAPSEKVFDLYAKLVAVTIGWKLTEKDLRTIGERIQNVEKGFNTREVGFTRKDDMIPWRFFDEPNPSGPVQDFRIRRDKWHIALDEYYRAHNWDIKTSLQTRRCLENLGLEKIADDLEDIGRLPK